MKKHLRGKRYLRSRASVQVGRDRKRQRKIEWFDALMQFLYDIQDAMFKVVRVVSEMTEGLDDAFQAVAAQLETQKHETHD